MTEHQVEPFNELISGRLERIVEHSLDLTVQGNGSSTRPVKTRYCPGSLSRGPAPSYHELAGFVLEGRTVSVPLFADMDVACGEDGPWKRSEKVLLGHIPVMVGSKWLPVPASSTDSIDSRLGGGYFVINGRDVVVPGLERTAHNRVLVVKPTDTKEENTVVVYSASMPPAQRASAMLRLVLLRNGCVRAYSDGRMGSTPVVTLLNALGMRSTDDISDACRTWGLGQEDVELLGPSFGEAAMEEWSKGPCLQSERDEDLSSLSWLLPHVGSDPAAKAFFVCHMLSTVLTNTGAHDDLDRLENKAVRLAADLVGEMIGMRLRHAALVFARSTARRKGDATLADLDSHRLVTCGLRNAMATGNWDGGRIGMTQTLSRYNILSAIYDLRTVRSSMCARPGDGAARSIQPRLVGASDAGIYDPFDSSGSQCGLTKTLAVTATVSGGSDEEQHDLRSRAATAVKSVQGVVPLPGKPHPRSLSVLVDGEPVAFAPVAALEGILRAIKTIRREAPPSRAVMSVEVIRRGRHQQLRIWTLPGRLCRPLLLPSNPSDADQEPPRSWADFVRHGMAGRFFVVCFWLVCCCLFHTRCCAAHPGVFDVAEAACGLTKHARELTGASVLAASAATVPFASSNQGPRIAFQCKMAKQAMSLSRPESWDQIKGNGGDGTHVLHYGQHPLVTTAASQLMGLDGDVPASSGCNVVLAIMSASGENMEDAIVVSKQAIERGLFRSTLFSQRLQAELPDVSAVRASPYEAVKEGDVLLAAADRPTRVGRMDCHDCTTRVASASVSSSSHGTAVAARVTLSTVCVPETGDKLSSRHGQKGVITVVDSVNMPFSESGVVPDLMINPHGMPSRMTAGQLWEMVFGKLRSVHRDADCVNPLVSQRGRVDGRAEELREALAEMMQAAGFHPLGDEDMMCGRTGELLEHRVFIAPVFYQRLKHLARPKMHARSTGARDPLTRQPVQGRARGGGVKTGYMELDCLNSYGACAFIRDRTFESSDAYRVHVDARTGLPVSFDARTGSFPRGTDPVQVQLPYAMKLLIHEIGAMNIVVKLNVARSAHANL